MPVSPSSTATGIDAVAVLQKVATPEYPGPALLGLKAKKDSLHQVEAPLVRQQGTGTCYTIILSRVQAAVKNL